MSASTPPEPAESGENGGVPIPKTQVQRKRSRMMQSSLDLVFSYTRSQHLHPALQSTPSFVGRSSPDRWLSYGATSSPHAEDIEDPRTPENEPTDPSSLLSPPLVAKEQGRSHGRRRSSGDGLILGHLDPSPSRSPLSSAASRQKGGSTGSWGHSDTAHHTDEEDGDAERSGRAGKQRQFSSISPRHLSPLPSPAVQTTADETTALLPVSPRPPRELLSPSSGRGLPRRKSLSDRLRPPPLPLGTSTTPQTLFNATSVLIGLSLLSAPLAFSYAGWIGGIILLLLGGTSTAYTAKLLGRLIRADPALLGYTDIASRAFGRLGGVGVGALFCLELAGLGVALLVLFGDSMAQLFPAHSVQFFIGLGGAIVLPTVLMPLHLLSLPSLISSMCSLLLFFVILYDGLAQPAQSEGSLWNPAKTSFSPEWQHGNVFGAVGLILAGFGGHAIMPSLCRDMRHPEDFDGVVNKAFTIATVITFAYGAVGYLMFGTAVSDEVTKDLMSPRYAFPTIISVVALWMVALNPVTKFGLASRPLNVTIESLLRLSPALPSVQSRRSTSAQSDRGLYGASYIARSSISAYATVPPSSPSYAHYAGTDPDPDLYNVADRKLDAPSHPSRSPARRATRAERRKAVGRIVSRTLVTGSLTGAAIYLPGFGRVMAFLGSFSSFLICIILPLLFYMRLEQRYPATLPTRTGPLGRVGQVGMLAVSGGLMAAGTAWAILPHDKSPQI